MISVSDMIKLENLSVKHGVSKIKLMENAGRGLFLKMNEKYDLHRNKVLILCGSGNNGGDGFVLAKYLIKRGCDCKILFLGNVEKLKKESQFNYWMLKEKNENIFLQMDYYDKIINNYQIIVDAILGTGVKGNIREPYSSIIDYINSSSATVVAVDIPTGIDPETGYILDKITRFDIIYTFHDIKLGLKRYQDKVEIIDIGIPKEAIDEFEKTKS